MYDSAPAGALVDAQTDSGWTPIHFAANDGSQEIIQILLDAGADPILRSISGNAAEDLARDRNHDDIVKLLNYSIVEIKEPETE